MQSLLLLVGVPCPLQKLAAVFPSHGDATFVEQSAPVYPESQVQVHVAPVCSGAPWSLHLLARVDPAHGSAPQVRLRHRPGQYARPLPLL